MADPAPALEQSQVIPEPLPEILDDSRAQKEAAAIAQKRLSRDDRMQGHLYYATVCIVWAFVLVLLAMGGVWVFHLLAPEGWQFLSDAQMDKLQTVLITAIGSSIVTDRAKKLNR